MACERINIFDFGSRIKRESNRQLNSKWNHFYWCWFTLSHGVYIHTVPCWAFVCWLWVYGVYRMVYAVYTFIRWIKLTKRKWSNGGNKRSVFFRCILWTNKAQRWQNTENWIQITAVVGSRLIAHRWKHQHASQAYTFHPFWNVVSAYTYNPHVYQWMVSQRW